MILKKVHYEVTKKEIARFEEARNWTASPSHDVPAAIRMAQYQALQSVLDELREEVEQFERLHPEQVG